MDATSAAVTRNGISVLPTLEHLPERVSLLYRLSGNDIPAIAVSAAIASFALIGYASATLIVAWLCWISLASVVRVALARLYRRRAPLPESAAERL